MKFKNLTIIGTSHIAAQSLKQVEQAFVDSPPGIVAIELDKKRFYALTHKVKSGIRFSDIRRIGFKGFLFSIIGSWVEKKLGKIVGVSPGSEMLRAVRLAKKHKSLLALIDQDIEITLKRISKYFSWREKWHLVVDLFKGIFFKESELAKLGVTDLDLTKVPSKAVIKKLIKNVKIRYPNLYKVLIHERNIVMAKNLYNLMIFHPDKQILAVVGAGHEDDLLGMIKKRHKE